MDYNEAFESWFTAYAGIQQLKHTIPEYHRDYDLMKHCFLETWKAARQATIEELMPRETPK